MAEFILVPDGLVNNFKGKAKRNGEELQWKAIEPISVRLPQNRSILPAEVLDDPDIMEAFPPLSGLPQVDESEVTPWQWDEETNTYY
jgi:hypothetical protein